MDPAALRKIAALVQDLPALPAVAQQALALLSDPVTEAEDLQRVLGRDPALSLKILRLANSAYYRRNREISTLTSAILLLGFKSVQTLILSSAVHRVLSGLGAAASSLWAHSFAAALACRELGRRGAGRGVDPDEAFLAGLFHDTAKGVIASRFPGIYGGNPGVAGEVELLGFHHGHLGQVLLARWEIPEPLSAAVGSHHEAEPLGLGRLAAVGDWLVWDVAPGVGAEPPAAPAALLRALEVGEADVDAIRRGVEQSLQEEIGRHAG